MLKKNPILIFFLVIAVVVIGGFAYKVFGDRYFKKESDLPKEMELNKNQNYFSNLNSSNPDINGNANSDVANMNTNENLNANSNVLPDITPKNCENRCADFEDENLDYCQEVCGLKAKNMNAESSDCSDKSGLTRDYCLKDLGVEKKDFNLCDQINDAKIKRSCRDRITEDMLD